MTEIHNCLSLSIPISKMATTVDVKRQVELKLDANHQGEMEI